MSSPPDGSPPAGDPNDFKEQLTLLNNNGTEQPSSSGQSTEQPASQAAFPATPYNPSAFSDPSLRRAWLDAQFHEIQGNTPRMPPPRPLPFARATSSTLTSPDDAPHRSGTTQGSSTPATASTITSTPPSTTRKTGAQSVSRRRWTHHERLVAREEHGPRAFGSYARRTKRFNERVGDAKKRTTSALRSEIHRQMRSGITPDQLRINAAAEAACNQNHRPMQVNDNVAAQRSTQRPLQSSAVDPAGHSTTALRDETATDHGEGGGDDRGESGQGGEGQGGEGQGGNGVDFMDNAEMTDGRGEQESEMETDEDEF
ncbi:hypothetical protein LTR37_017088 [Vermiconidia calcicola]|uniref:Uncharacterized protein n=1 Tax=Vermiconidia calcicola TaxID=1690605 RepID=A0ACC3MML2_9PEZI|nr:hypothetical protein LTR37_017088 [Vermiconidia calcicola]